MFKYFYILPRITAILRLQQEEARYVISVDVQYKEYHLAPVQTLATAKFNTKTRRLTDINWAKNSMMPIAYLGNIFTLVPQDEENKHRVIKGHFQYSDKTRGFVLEDMNPDLFLE